MTSSSYQWRRESGGSSSTLVWKRYTPGATCALLIENAAVRTSTDATFVLQIIVPSNQMPGRMVSVEKRIAKICGRASGAATAGVGSAREAVAPTVIFAGTATGLLEHAPSRAA